jgi:ornithine carbamoyltransferase
MKHYLQFNDFTKEEYHHLLKRAQFLKETWESGKLYQPLQGKVMCMIFEKSSTRSRVSFEAGMFQLGGHAIFLSSKDSQFGRGEPIADSGKVISRMVDIVMIRTFDQSIIEEFASTSRVPVINALTNQYHPCQILADIYTYMEKYGSIEGKTVAWIGDNNNMSYSWLQAAKVLGFKLRVATPRGYEMKPFDGIDYSDCLFETYDPNEAVVGADIITTDVFTSMGYEEENEVRQKVFAPYKVTSDMMKLANPDAMFLHCLPAHRGEEVDADVIDGPQSDVWNEAGNRLHTQKAIIEYLLLGKVDM